jgi:NAD-dependent deacetylase sirtuin 2
MSKAAAPSFFSASDAVLDGIQLARELFPGQYRPTPTHHFIRMLHDKGILRRCFTQNIDSLESQAGLPKEMCVAAHGNFDGATCISTGEAVPVEEVKDAIFSDDPGSGWEALRDRYGGLVKPNITFFGEKLPERFYQLSGIEQVRPNPVVDCRP